MKILFLNDNLNKGGRERRMIELIKGLMKYPSIEIELVLFKNVIEYPEIHELNVTLHIIERKPKHNPLTFVKLYDIAKKNRPDVIHAWSSMSAIFAVPATKLLSIKFMNSKIANAPDNLSIWQLGVLKAKLAFLFSDMVIGNSKAGLKAFSAPKNKSYFIYNGFDFRRTGNLKKADVIKSKYNIGSDKVVGKIAAFADRKDYDTFIAAASEIIRLRNDITFLAIGKGPDLERIKNSVSGKAKEKIVFTGSINDVESVINIFDIGILSTNADVHGEGISNSIMEYMALGKPVVATTGGGTNEIVLDGKTGFLVAPKSPEVLANKILELIDDPKKAEKMGAAGQKRIKKHFNLDTMTETYLNLYYKLLEGKR